MPINALIPLGVKHTPIMTPFELQEGMQKLESGHQLNQLGRMKLDEGARSERSRNALLDMVRQPGAIDEKTGLLSRNALAQFSQIDPSGAATYGAKVAEAEKDQQQVVKSQYDMMSDHRKELLAARKMVSDEAKLKHDEVFRQFGDKSKAAVAGSAVLIKYREQWRQDGSKGDAWKNMPMQYDDAAITADLSNPIMQFVKQDRTFEQQGVMQDRRDQTARYHEDRRDERQRRGLEAIAARGEGGSGKPPAGYRWNADRSSLEEIPGGPAERLRRDAGQADEISLWRAENPQLAAGMPPSAARGEKPFHEWKASRGSIKTLGKAPAGDFVVGKVYEDAKGNRARYTAGGTWEPVQR